MPEDELEQGSESFILELESLLKERKEELPADSYTTKLYKKGTDKILQKLGEECVEYIIEAKNRDKARATSEGADLVYHFLVSLQEQDLALADIAKELKDRHLK